MNIGCVAITDGKRTSIGFSSAFAYPPACWIPAVRDREPIGEIFDRLWESHGGERPKTPSAGTVGNIGHLSGGVLPRAEYARHGVLCALVAFLQPSLYGLAESAL
jgi:non-canonical (house-cleaning) NTP pyrophosphatase